LQKGDEKLSSDVLAAIIDLTAQYNNATTKAEKDRIHNLANDYRSGAVKPTNEVSTSSLQSDISAVLSNSKTTSEAKNVISNSVLSTFNAAPDVAKNSIVSGINNAISNNRNQVIQAVSLLDALRQTSTNLSSIQSQSSTWTNLTNTVNPLFSSNMQALAYGQMAGVESLLLSNGIVQGNDYITYMLTNALLSGAALDTRTIDQLQRALLAVESYNNIYQTEKDKKIKQTSSALLDAIPGVNSLKSIAQAFTGSDLITGEHQTLFERGFNVGLALLDVKAFKSLGSVGRVTETWGGKTLEELASLHLSDSGQTVLGRYVKGGGYIAKAEKMNASYFDIGDIWNTMKEGERWSANTRFLDIIAERGNQVYLSVSKQNIKPGTYLAEEIQYLTKEKGYKWINQWSLVKK
jgi:hypothetical protein